MITNVEASVAGPVPPSPTSLTQGIVDQPCSLLALAKSVVAAAMAATTTAGVMHPTAEELVTATVRVP